MIKKKIIKKSNNNWLDSFEDGGLMESTKPPGKSYKNKFNTKLKNKVSESFNYHSTLFPDLLNDTEDYDTRGFYNDVYNQNNGNIDAITRALTPGTSTEHLGTDIYKKPNHPTFSNESKYSIPILRPGGKWGHNEEENYDFFKANKRNIKNMNNSDGSPLNYFKRAEDYNSDGTPDVKLFYKGKEQFASGGKIDPVKSEYNPLNPQPLEFNSGVPNFDIYSSIKYNPIPNFKDESMDIYGDKDIDLINKSKSDYFNYLDSPQYLETARKTWGNNANKYIDKQKQNIQNTPIVPYKNMKFWDQIKVGSSKAHFDNVRNQILNYSGENPVLIHELSHTTDSKELPKDFWKTDYTDRPGEYVTRTDSINPKYNNPNFIKDAALMSPEYSKWNELFSTDNSNIDHNERPTEIRAYINTIRQQMSSDNFDWNKKSPDEIRKYIELLNNSDNEELKTTIKSLKNKDKEISDLKIKALQDLAINNKNNNVLKVKNGGWLNNYANGGLVGDPTKPFNPINNRDGYFPGMNNQTLVSDATAVKKQVLPTQNELQINKLNNAISNQPKSTISPMKKEFVSEKPSAWEQKMLQKQEEANTMGRARVTFNQFGEPVLQYGMVGQPGFTPPASGRVNVDYMDPLTMAVTMGAGAYGKGLNLADAALLGLDWGTYGVSSLGKSIGKAGINALKNPNLIHKVKNLERNITIPLLNSKPALKIRDSIINNINQNSAVSTSLFTPKNLENFKKLGVIHGPEGTITSDQFLSLFNQKPGSGELRTYLRDRFLNNKQFGVGDQEAVFHSPNRSFKSVVNLPHGYSSTGKFSNFYFFNNNPISAGRTTVELDNLISKIPGKWEFDPGSLSGDSYPIWSKIVNNKAAPQFDLVYDGITGINSSGRNTKLSKLNSIIKSGYGNKNIEDDFKKELEKIAETTSNKWNIPKESLMPLDNVNVRPQLRLFKKFKNGGWLNNLK